MAKQVLITGGAGFIGSFIADQMVTQGYKVRLLDNLDPQVHPNGQPDYINKQAELIVADVRDKSALEKVIKDVDFIIHCASAVGVGQSMYQVKHYVDVNVHGTATLLEAIVERECPIEKLVIFASMTGYGEGVYQRPSDKQLMRVNIRTQTDIKQRGWEPTCPNTGEVLVPVPTPEDSGLLAANVYALTKRYQEELALSLGQTYDFPVVCFRLFNVYGPRQSLSNPYTGVLAIFLSRLLNDQSPVVYEDGKQTRDFVSVHDVVQATILGLNNSAADYKVINIGTGVPREICEVARTLAKLLGKSDIEPKITGQFRRGDIRHCYADISQAKRVLGFSPSTEWEESLMEIIEWSVSAATADQFEQAYDELSARGFIK